MRIRSILPDFYRSEDVAAMDWDTRLVFIGLWSYVDDNGVGRDNERLIMADLFPLEADPTETLRRVSTALEWLSEHGQIQRYSVKGTRYLFVDKWDKYQRVQNPGKARYPRPTCENVDPPEVLHRVSGDTTENLSPGEGEKGRRGEGEKDSPASTDVEREFAEWYDAYPRKRDKGHAIKAYRAARKKTDADTLLEAIRRQAPTLTRNGAEFAPYPATWLNGERWTDEPDSETPTAPVRHLPHARDIEQPPDGLTPEQMSAWYAEQREKRRRA